MANAYNPDGTINADNILGNIGNWWNSVNKPINLQPNSGIAATDWRTAGQLQSNPMNLMGGTFNGTLKGGTNPNGNGGGAANSGVMDAYNYQQITNAPKGPSTEDQIAALLQQILGGSGGGANTSGYNALLKDIKARKTALKKRYKANAAGIEELYTGAATAREADKVAIDKAATQRLEDEIAAQEDRAAQINQSETDRLNAVNEARAALGAATSTGDLVTKTVKGGISRLDERSLAGQQDIQTAQSIQEQQIQDELSGYTSAQQLATQDLQNAYEDRIAQLASERASVKAQIAQAMAAGGGGNSPSEIMAAMQFAQQQVMGPQAELNTKDPSSIINYYSQQTGRNYAPIANAIYAGLNAYDVNDNTGKLMDPVMLYNTIAKTNSAVTQDPNFSIQLIRSLLQGK